MQLMRFDTEIVPQDARLTTFRMGAFEFRVDSLRDPGAFSSRWRMLKLGDLNVIHAYTSPIHYQRDAAMIAADGEDRITIHYYIVGGEVGTIGGRAVEALAGGAMIWDLAVPLDMKSIGDIETIIVTLPRYMIDEVLPAPSLAGPLAPSAELSLAAEQARYLIDHAADLPDAAAAFYGRALRDMLAVAMLPAYRSVRPMTMPDAPLLQRIVDLIDAQLSMEPTIDAIAARLGVDPVKVTDVAEHFGGLPLLAERRRLLGAYRMLCDVRETDTVSMIAHRCGFDSLPHFSRRFSSVFHTSASDLRRFGRSHLPSWAGAYHVEKLYSALIAS